jgi:hypothetical protein
MSIVSLTGSLSVRVPYPWACPARIRKHAGNKGRRIRERKIMQKKGSETASRNRARSDVEQSERVRVCVTLRTGDGARKGRRDRTGNSNAAKEGSKERAMRWKSIDKRLNGKERRRFV